MNEITFHTTYLSVTCVPIKNVRNDRMKKALVLIQDTFIKYQNSLVYIYKKLSSFTISSSAIVFSVSGPVLEIPFNFI